MMVLLEGGVLQGEYSRFEERGQEMDNGTAIDSNSYK